MSGLLSFRLSVAAGSLLGLHRVNDLGELRVELLHGRGTEELAEEVGEAVIWPTFRPGENLDANRFAEGRGGDYPNAVFFKARDRSFTPAHKSRGAGVEESLKIPVKTDGKNPSHVRINPFILGNGWTVHAFGVHSDTVAFFVPFSQD